VVGGISLINDYKEPDDLQMYFGADFQVTEYIRIHQPTIGEIIEYGEADYYQMIGSLCIIPSDVKSMLWDSGIDWEKISDFELFCLLDCTLPIEKTSILFGDLDFTKFKMMQREDNNEMVLYQRVIKGNKDNSVDMQDIIVDKMVYQKIVDYIRRMHRMHPKVEHALNKRTKDLLIELDRQDHEKAKREKYNSQLLSLISGLLCSAEFKYKKSELKEVGIYEFFDSVARIQVIKSADALLKGCYGGFIDTSHIDKKELNWLRDLNEESDKGLMQIKNDGDSKKT
jgi:hypothetical protein